MLHLTACLNDEPFGHSILFLGDHIDINNGSLGHDKYNITQCSDKSWKQLSHAASLESFHSASGFSVIRSSHSFIAVYNNPGSCRSPTMAPSGLQIPHHNWLDRLMRDEVPRYCLEAAVASTGLFQDGQHSFTCYCRGSGRYSQR